MAKGIEVGQEQVDAASEAEQQLFNDAVVQAQMQYLHQRNVLLRSACDAYEKKIEELEAKLKPAAKKAPAKRTAVKKTAATKK